MKACICFYKKLNYIETGTGEIYQRIWFSETDNVYRDILKI